MLGGSLLWFLLLFYFFPPLRSDRGRLSRLLFFLSFFSFICFFGCSDGMEREACVCDHGLERSDLCAQIIIIIIIISLFRLFVAVAAIYTINRASSPSEENK